MQSELRQLSDYLKHTQNGCDAIIQEICQAAANLASSHGHTMQCEFIKHRLEIPQCTCGACDNEKTALLEMNRVLRKYKPSLLKGG